MGAREAWLMAFLVVLPAHAQWQSESTLATTNLQNPSMDSSPKVTCANLSATRAISCIYTDWTDSTTRMDLREIISTDGGLTWSPPTSILSTTGDEYDPFVHYDSVRQRLWLVYSRWWPPPPLPPPYNNEVVITYKTASGGSWAPPIVVAHDADHEYWIPSVLALQSGKILVFSTRDGPESSHGPGSGVIEVRRSSDSGQTWGDPVMPWDSCGDEEYARAVQNSYGSILLTFGKYVDNSHPLAPISCQDGSTPQGFPNTDIHEVWSGDDGATWTQHSILHHDASGPSFHPFVATETGQPQTACAGCQITLTFVKPASNGDMAVFGMHSLDQGETWSSPRIFSTSTWSQPFNVDPGFTIGCRGFFEAFTSGYPGQTVSGRRYDWTSSCAL